MVLIDSTRHDERKCFSCTAESPPIDDMLRISPDGIEGADLKSIRGNFSRVLYKVKIHIHSRVAKLKTFVFLSMKMQTSLDQIFQKLGDLYGVSLSYEILDITPERSPNKPRLPAIGNHGQYTQNLYSEHFYPEGHWDSLNTFQNETAFIIQGTLGDKPNDLFQAINMYLVRYPYITVILSTWKNEYAKIDSDLLQHQRFRVVLNEDPQNPGISNINRQIISTYAGLQESASLGKKYSVKLRTDQHMLSPKALQILNHYASTFAIENDQAPRILGVSRNTFKYRFYTFSDMFHFGLTESLLMYWDVSPDSRTSKDLQGTDLSNLEEFSRANLVETYLQINYMKKRGWIPTYTLEDSLKVYGELFVVIDEREIGLIWNKYSRNSKYWASNRIPNKFEELTVGEWLYLYSVKNN